MRLWLNIYNFKNCRGGIYDARWFGFDKSNPYKFIGFEVIRSEEKNFSDR